MESKIREKILTYYLQNRDRFTDVENRLVTGKREERRRGKDSESGIS